MKKNTLPGLLLSCLCLTVVPSASAYSLDEYESAFQGVQVDHNILAFAGCGQTKKIAMLRAEQNRSNTLNSKTMVSMRETGNADEYELQLASTKKTRLKRSVLIASDRFNAGTVCVLIK